MKKITIILIRTLILLIGLPLIAQNQRDIDNFRNPDQRGINQFEAPKDSLTTFNGVQVRIGGASTIQFQALDHENSNNEATPQLIEIGDNFNLATANLDLDVVLYDGVRMHLRTYLSSQHHPEAWVKGGYIQIDKLEFVSEGFAEELMEKLRIKIGHMEVNYGDAHFRRTDNAMALYNPFVGNYLMDSFTTEVGAEIYYFCDSWLGMAGITNGKLNQSVENPNTTSPSFVAKIGYDREIEAYLRLRLTGSIYHTAQTRTAYLYSGDRSGSRYYNIFTDLEGKGDSFRAGRINPNFRNELTSIMINPFIKYGGLEFFGIYERAQGKASAELNERTWNHYAGELIYRFGGDDDLYLGGRYSSARGDLTADTEVYINRIQLSTGWFLTKNILMKLEYVHQKYNDYPVRDIHNDGKFEGFMMEAAISF
ncbi:hypothetical protein [Christiangramia aquimixticola]|uniref:hypothetical protein n=1 Tax=Christiangramia aquimixticola TaxID=1697558 RepID=UPI003AA8107F